MGTNAYRAGSLDRWLTREAETATEPGLRGHEGWEPEEPDPCPRCGWIDAHEDECRGFDS